MSRKSEQGSAGDGESPSLLPSYENSPRKSPERTTTGPFGDHSNDKKISLLMYHVDDTNNSTDTEDQECFQLQNEYLERLRLIREKLSSIDIANKTYYKNCFRYPPQSQGQCVITEIFDEVTETNNCNDDVISNFKANSIGNDINVKSSEESPINKLTESKGDEQNDFTENKSDEQNDSVNNPVCLKLSGSIDQDKPQEGPFLTNDKTNDNFIAENDKTEKSDLGIKSILNYGSFRYDDSSSIELLDLNYNPPKKKPCIRENTPKMVLSEGAILLPYHTRLGLQNGLSCINNEALESENKCDEKTEINMNLGDSIEQNGHIFPEVKVEAIEEIQDMKSSESSHDKLKPDEDKNSPTISVGKDNLYVLFLDALEQSSSESPKTNRTIVTETTVTIESPTRKLKKRRLLLRSAKNKVKPVDSISLWEEIRTMDAINRSKRRDSSSSKESYFQEILLDEVERDHALDLDLKSVGSLEVPRKASITARFPSITKITKFCQSAFKKKSQTTVEGKVTKEDPHGTGYQKEEYVPKVANTLLNLRQEQQFNFENDHYTPSSEAHSEYPYPEEDIDAYYKPDCIFCFCF